MCKLIQIQTFFYVLTPYLCELSETKSHICWNSIFLFEDTILFVWRRCVAVFYTLMYLNNISNSKTKMNT